MTRRERVLQAIRHQPTDMVPYEVLLTSQERKELEKYTGNPGYLSTVGNHISIQWYSETMTETEPGSEIFCDTWGVYWDKSSIEKDIGLIKGVLLEEPDINDLKVPPFEEAGWRNGIETMLKEANGRACFAALGFALYDKACTFRGTENFLMDLLLEPEFTEELLDVILKRCLEVVDVALEYDIDGFYFADDWGQQRGLIMGPELWRQFIKPRMAILYDRIKKAGKIVVQHSCGNNLDIFEDLIEIGLDVYQTLQPEIYDLPQIKKDFGDRLAFWGGISTQRLLPFGTPEEVKQEVEKTLKLMSEGGGYIASASHDIVEGIPPENVIALVDTLMNQK
ncbi:uroporphyrinogen decarboxylase family protein [Massiliimalia massiliensis]|uniref:uroporphyrinogen decarboxylase family protein n=1 Tax=Massiliimalia massiliensis TaxID=1852384 RepID=UPI0009860AFA|nr:uroporphyrinogen decarboxylase family protein [Massiliimalia massiliensis]